MNTATLDVALEIQPYPGLRPFREDETHLYFGREQHRGELLKRLAATRFVAVIGTSGSGKSSLVRAGLLPDLLSGYLAGAGSDWVIVESRPGADPLGRLAAAFTAAGWTTDAAALRTNSSQILELARHHLAPGQHLLVLVDQLEELFRLKTSADPAEDADEKAAFARLLLNAGGQRTDMIAHHPCVHVVVAMRSEFLGRASVYRGLPEAIDQGQYLIPRLSRDQLRKAIESPARVAGGELEEALIQRLLNDLGDDQDHLPVLQHALLRCWQFRDDEDRVGLDAYDKSGQLERALSMDANEALAETCQVLGDRGTPILSRVFQALRETDVNGGQTRRPTTAGELCEMAACTIEELTTALAPFRARSFVLPPPDKTLESSRLIDISHEALLRGWDALKRWIDEDEFDRTRYLRLANRAAEEQGAARPQYIVPPQLDLLLKFWAERKPPRAWALRHHAGYERAKAFLDESGAHRRAMETEDANRRAAEARQKQDLADAIARTARTKRRVLIGSSIGIVMIGLGGFALWDALERTALLAKQNWQLAQQTEQLAQQTDQLEKQTDTLNDQATQLQSKTNDLTKYNSKLQMQTEQLEEQRSRLEEEGNRLAALLLAAKVSNIPETNVEARLQLAAEVVRRSPSLESRQELLKALFVASTPRTPDWAASLGKSVDSVAISPVGDTLYAVADGHLRAIDVLANREQYSVPMSAFPMGRSAYLAIADQKLLLVKDGGVHVVDARTGRLLASPAFKVRAWTTSRRGTKAAFLVPDRTAVIVCDLTDNCGSPATHDIKTLLTDDSGRDSGNDLAVSDDGNSLAVIGSHHVALFDTMSGKQRKVRRFEGDDALRILGSFLAIGVDARHVMVCTSDNLVQYDAYDNTLDPRIIRKFPTPASACVRSDKGIASAHSDGTVRVWNLEGRPVSSVLARVDDWEKIALGEATLVVAGERLHVWDTVPFGRRNLPSPKGFARNNAYAYTEGQQIALDSGVISRGPRLQYQNRAPVAVSDSLRFAIYASGEQLLRAMLHEDKEPDQSWMNKLPTSEPAVRGNRAVRVAIDPEERHIAYAFNNQENQPEIHIFDAKTGGAVKPISGRSLIAFAPTGELLTFDGTKVEIVSLKDGNPVPRISIPFETADSESRAFGPNGPRRIAPRPVTAAFSPDRRRLALAVVRGQNSEVRFFEWPALTQVRSLQHSGSVMSLSFKSDGQEFLTSTADGTTHVWKLANLEEVLRIPSRGQPISAVFTPSGGIAILDDGGLTVLPLPTDRDLVNEACRRILRNLDPAQWTTLVGTTFRHEETCPTRP